MTYIPRDIAKSVLNAVGMMHGSISGIFKAGMKSILSLKPGMPL